MDPISDLPPVTGDPAANAGDPAPPLPTNHLHPPYAEMITAAITALKDKDGSSRQAISKYIEKEYNNLPSTHSVLLTHHLKRMKNQGELVIVKHSYMLPPPRSGHFQPAIYQPNLDFPVTATDATAITATTADVNPDVLSKRKPGRPAKLKPVSGFRSQIPPEVQNVQPYDAVPPADVQAYDQFGYQLGVGQDFQGQSHYGPGTDNSAGAAEPLFASLGLGDETIAVPSSPPAENTAMVVKRGRGRPPKVARVKKGRGRPRKIGIGAVTVPLSGNVLRPRGKPKRAASRPSVVVNGGVGEVGLGSRRRGRPSKYGEDDMIGTPFGSLSKVGPGTAVLVTDPQQLVAYQELNNKYELLQSKVKQVAGMVKSSIDPNYGAAALGALQELEAMAGTQEQPPLMQT